MATIVIHPAWANRTRLYDLLVLASTFGKRIKEHRLKTGKNVFLMVPNKNHPIVLRTSGS